VGKKFIFNLNNLNIKSLNLNNMLYKAIQSWEQYFIDSSLRFQLFLKSLEYLL
jgi:hypothetical protein